MENHKLVMNWLSLDTWAEFPSLKLKPKNTSQNKKKEREIKRGET